MRATGIIFYWFGFRCLVCFSWHVKFWISKATKNQIASDHKIKQGESVTVEHQKKRCIYSHCCCLLSKIVNRICTKFLCGLNDLYVVYLWRWLFALVVLEIHGGTAASKSSLQKNPCNGLSISLSYTRNFPEDFQNVEIKWMYSPKARHSDCRFVLDFFFFRFECVFVCAETQ